MLNSNYCQTRVNKSLRSAFSLSCGDCVIWLGARWIQCILPKTLPELAAGESVFGAQPDLHPSVLTLVAVLSRIYTLCWSLSLTPLFLFQLSIARNTYFPSYIQQNTLVIRCSLGKTRELETETEISGTDFENDDRVYRSVMKLTCEHEDFTISKVVTWHSTSFVVKSFLLVCSAEFTEITLSTCQFKQKLYCISHQNTGVVSLCSLEEKVYRRVNVEENDWKGFPQLFVHGEQ